MFLAAIFNICCVNGLVQLKISDTLYYLIGQLHQECLMSHKLVRQFECMNYEKISLLFLFSGRPCPYTRVCSKWLCNAHEFILQRMLDFSMSQINVWFSQILAVTYNYIRAHKQGSRN